MSEEPTEDDLDGEEFIESSSIYELYPSRGFSIRSTNLDEVVIVRPSISIVTLWLSKSLYLC